MKNAQRIKASLPLLIQNYLNKHPSLSGCYDFAPDWEGFIQAYAQREKYPINRPALVEALTKQAKSSAFVSKESLANIQSLLNDQTFTVTTGHQLGILGGPLFFFYKIMSTIKIAERAKENGYNVVPVFWLASEDHDFEEISSVLLGDKEVEWNIKSNGPVGRLSLDGFETVLNEVVTWLKAARGDVFSIELLKTIYSPEKTLSDATKDLVYWLFGKHGIVVLDAADSSLKRLIAPLMEKECLHRESFQAVNQTSINLSKLGYQPQVSPREINLFYMYDGYRERIEYNGESWNTTDNKHQWNRQALVQQITESPESFSPNVVLRPVYQELILPNLAYIGGPGELSYWLQLKAVFELHGVFFPQLILRDMVLYMDQKTNKRMEQLNLTVEDCYQPFDALLKALLKQEGTHEFVVDDAKEEIQTLLNNVVERLANLNPGLGESGRAEQTRILNRLEKLSKKVWRADRKANEILERRLGEWKSMIQPNGIPQERVLNWLTFFGTGQVHKEIDELLKHFNPFDGSLLVIQENNK